MSAEASPTELLAKLLTSAPDGLLLVNPGGIIRYANRAAEALFQRGPGTLTGQPFGLPHVAGLDDIDLVRSDGTLRTVEMRPVETTWQGEPVWVIALRDATEQRHREQQLQTQLETSSELTGELSHELVTSLTLIIGLGGAFEKHWEQLTDDKRRELVGRIGVQARRTQRMLRRMLLTDPTHPCLSGPHPEPVELWEVVLSHLPGLGVPSVHIDCPPSLCVQADPGYLDEIVVNLVENAAQYGAPPITVSAHQTGDMVEITVSDHGPGVPEDFTPRLFDRASPADDSTDHPNGTGLGLQLVGQLARASGGTVRYEANEPEGSRFIVTLPAA